MPATLDAQLEQIKTQIDSTHRDAQNAWSAFDKLRGDLAASDVSTEEGTDAFTKADEKHKAYTQKAQELAELNARREALWAMNGEKGRPDGPDKHARERLKDIAHSGETWGGKVVSGDLYAAAMQADAFRDREGKGPEVRFGEVTSRAQLHALLTTNDPTSAGAITSIERRGGIVGLPQIPLVLTDLVTVTQTDDDSIEIVKEKGWTNAAAFVPEATSANPIGSGNPAVTAAQAGLKPQSALQLEVEKISTSTVAHWIAVTRKTMRNKARVQSLVDTRLRNGLELALQAGMAVGDGVGETFLGLYNQPDLLSQAVGLDSRVDAIHKGLTKIRLKYYEPNAVGMNPLTWQDIRLDKNENGDYHYGPPALAGPQVVWGKPVVAHEVFPAAADMVGDFSQAELAIKSGIEVLTSDSHVDFFTRNIIALLAEMEAAFGVHAPKAFCEVTA